MLTEINLNTASQKTKTAAATMVIPPIRFSSIRKNKDTNLSTLKDIVTKESQQQTNKKQKNASIKCLANAALWTLV
ncbi:hypothetical protein PR048_014522 [Dryococelus australis]|uniref:Uncharacterized protein n=1 Tax=Dryococelus australis TaxID=614101 RepID=A0ABQ9HEM3_9NEOP|nr:hypothetical protein PR048_014522 [Dryococelus australis]